MNDKCAKDRYDVIIIGCGPAGLQAAIHAARRKAEVLVLGKPEASNLYRAHVENYCCVEGVHSGKELIEAGIRQAESFGAEFVRQDVTGTAQVDSGFEITVEDGSVLKTLAIIMTTGISKKGLGVKGEKELVGRGLSYCVDCDANFYRGATVAVTGDGSAAMHGALTLSRIAEKTWLIAKEIKADPALVKELEKSNVEIVIPGRIREFMVSDKLDGVILEDGREIMVDGLFVETGAKGAMELVAFLGVTLDPEKFTHILTDEKQATNIPGIYAAGDICGLPYQMAKAVGEGCVAGISAASYAAKLKREKGENNS
jgi:thioredoxin reductase (NADPH)